MMEVDLVLKEENAMEWTYRGEGAANIVLGYTGSSPAFVGIVLRIQKAPRKAKPQSTTATSVLSTHEKLLWKDAKDFMSSSTSEEFVG